MICAIPGLGFASNSDEDILRAMQDELSRSMKELRLESLKKPYFIEYTIKVRDSHSAQASLGALAANDNERSAQLTVNVRVGSENFDNTNFFDVGLGFFGSSDDEESFKSRDIPIELSYGALRRELWLATDAAYKQAAEILSKKEASYKNRIRKDTTPDFSFPAKKVFNEISQEDIPSFNNASYAELIKKVSDIFNKYPKVFTSKVGFEYLPVKTYYVNSEGSKYVKVNHFAGIEASCFTQAEDGMPLSQYFTAYADKPENLPAADSIARAVESIAKNLTDMRDASVLDDSYSGPVLFSGQAAGELFAQFFLPNLVAQREISSEGGFSATGDRNNAFQTKIGGRVLPEFISVTAKPTDKAFGKTPLVGSYLLDDEGTPAQDVNLVVKGYLKTLLSSRTPIKRVTESNGHKRGGAPMLSSLFIESSKPSTDKELKARFIKLLKDRDLPFGIFVNKVMNSNVFQTSIYNLSGAGFDVSFSNSKMQIVEAYKLYPDGKMEILRGVEAQGIAPASFKDIIATGNTSYAMNYLAPAVVSSFVTGGEMYQGASVVTPSILLEDAEIKPLDGNFHKLPTITNPLSGK